MVSTAGLAVHLAALPDAEVAALLRERPDLAAPAVSSFTALAARAGGRSSVEAVLARLDGPTLAVAQQVVADAQQTAPAAGTPEAQSPDARSRPPEEAPSPARPPETPEAASGGRSTALRGPQQAQSAAVQSPTQASASVAAAPQDQSLCAERPVRLSQRLGLETTAAAASLALLERLALLADGAPVTGLLEALAPAAGAPPRPYPVVPPDTEALPRLPAEVVAAESARHAEEAVRLVAALLVEWGQEGGTILRGGGVGARVLTRTAQALGADQPTTATVIELAAAAGLLGLDEEGSSWVPSATARDWAQAIVPERWAVLAAAWAGSLRTPWLVGSRGDDGSLRPALHDGVEAAWAGALRRRLLRLLTSLPQGAAVDPAWVRAALTFARPRRPFPPGSVSAVLAEARLLGLTGAGAPSRAGLALAAVRLPVAGSSPAQVAACGLAGSAAAGAKVTDAVPHRATWPDEPADAVLTPLEEALAADLSTPVDLLLVQSDLTAVVPGRPVPELAALLEMAGVVESRDPALTVRFTPDSVRAALDQGHTGRSLLAALAEFSPSPLPGALEVLVQDVERRHGGVRVRAVAAVLRVADPATAAGLLADPGLAGLGLTEVAPGVLAATATPGQVLRVLRAKGLAPVLEDAAGQVLLAGSNPVGRRRAAPPPSRPGGLLEARHRVQGERELGAFVRRLRAGQAELERGGSAAGAATDPVHALALLRQALAARTPVRLVVADPAGGTQERRVRVLAVEEGRVRLADLSRQTELTVAVHRIVSVSPQ